jgi:hypothetical protein
MLTKSCNPRTLRRVRIAGIAPIAAVAALLFVVSCRGREGQNAAASEEQLLRDKIAALTRQEQVLSADYSLAKDPNPYLALDCGSRKIDLKVQGHSLRSYSVARIQRSGGAAAAAEVWIKTDIKPLQSTSREKVVPGSGEATTASVAAKAPWGPQRMPSDYDVICRGNQVLAIRALPAESRNRFVRWFVGGYRRFTDWTRKAFGRRNAGFRDVIEVWMSEDDARLLFWSLPKQFGILLLNAP